MRLTLFAGLVGVLALAVTGCGSSSYRSSARSAVSHLADTFATYNRAPQSNLAQTASACRSAESGVTAVRLPTVPASGRYHAIATSLARAYGVARAGFADCAAAAQHGNYRAMVRAQSEISQANTWLARARGQDR